MMNKKRLRLATLLFAMTFLVGAAFAATNGALVFGGTVRINSVGIVEEARLEFVSTRIMCVGQATSSIVEDSGRQFLTFETVLNYYPNAAWPTVMSQVEFEIQNTGNVPVELFDFEYLLEGGQMFDITVFGTAANSINLLIPTTQPRTVSMTIAPGEVVSGQMLYNPLLSVPQGDFTEVVFNQRFALNYRVAR